MGIGHRGVAFAIGAVAMLALPQAAFAQSSSQETHDFAWYMKRADMKACTTYSEAADKSGAGLKACEDLISSGKYHGTDLAALYAFRADWRSKPEEQLADYTLALTLSPADPLQKQIQLLKGKSCYALKRWACAWGGMNDGWGAMTFSDGPRYLDAGIHALGSVEMKGRLDQAISSNGKDAFLLFLRSMYYELQGDYPKAATDATAAAQARPNVSQLQNNACWYLAALQHQADAALPYCASAVGLSPDNPGIWDSRGAMNLVAGKPAEALKDYERTLALNPQYAHGMYGKGIALVQLGRKAEGDAAMAAAVKIDASVADDYRADGITPRGIVAATPPKPSVVPPPGG